MAFYFHIQSPLTLLHQKQQGSKTIQHFVNIELRMFQTGNHLQGNPLDPQIIKYQLALYRNIELQCIDQYTCYSCIFRVSIQVMVLGLPTTFP